MYDPTIGRWLSEDPIGFEAGDSNPYRYVGNSPTNATDPSGLKVYDEPPGAKYFLDEMFEFRAIVGLKHYLQGKPQEIQSAKDVIAWFKGKSSLTERFKLIPHWITYSRQDGEKTPTLQFAEDAAAKAKKNPNSVFLYIGHGVERGAGENTRVDTTDVEAVKSALSGIPKTTLIWFVGCFGSAYNSAIGQNAFQNMPANAEEATIGAVSDILAKARESLSTQLDSQSKRAGGVIEINVYFGEYDPTRVPNALENQILEAHAKGEPERRKDTWMKNYSFSKWW